MAASDRPYFSLEYPIRLAHRGSRTLWPENTAYAFRQAIDLGFRYIETDVRMTNDGVIVVFHDASVDRTTNGAGEIAKLDWSHLERLDAAHHFQPGEGYPLRDTGIGISRLGDILTMFPDTHFNIDLKAPGMEWAVADVLKRMGAEDRILVGAFSDARLRKFRRITRGTVATSAGPAEATALWAASRLGRRGPGVPDAYQIPAEAGPMHVDERMVQAAHARGTQVHVWTVNEEGEMRRFLDMGVDGIITDRPDLLNGVLGS